MENSFALPPVMSWIGNVPAAMVHHIHILVEDIEQVKQAYQGVSGVDGMEVHDIRSFNGCLALMVNAKPVSVEYLQVINPEIGLARLLKDEPLGLNAIDFLVYDGEEAVKTAKAAGYIVTGRMKIYECQEIWLYHPELHLSIEFMVPPPADYRPGSDPQRDKAQVHIYGLDGKEDLYFE